MSVPLIQVLIKKKRDGDPLSANEIQWFLEQFDKGYVSDAQMSAMLMAVVFRGLGQEELATWTRVMVASGDTLSLRVPHRVDKHSTGGVGDKTSFIVAPIAAALGCYIPMLSGRTLGHTGGTLDKLLAIPGFRIPETSQEIVRLVERYGLCFAGPTGDISPLDRKLYALRDVTGTVESMDLIASSIMSKKLSESLEGLVMDVKFGCAAFIKDPAQASMLFEKIRLIGRAHGVVVRGVLSDMNQPLGRYFGLRAEIYEVLQTFEGKGPKDLIELCVKLASLMVLVGGLAKDEEKAQALVWSALKDGRAYTKFCDIIGAQGGNLETFANKKFYIEAPYKKDVIANHSGTIVRMDTEALGYLLVRLGGGRDSTDAQVDPWVGAYLHAKIGDPVRAGDPVLTCYAGRTIADDVIEDFLACFEIRDAEAPVLPLILEVW